MELLAVAALIAAFVLLWSGHAETFVTALFPGSYVRFEDTTVRGRKLPERI